MSAEESDAVRRLLAEGLDWTYIVDKARRHGLAPLLYFNLKAVDGIQTIPLEARTALAERYHASLVHYMEFYQELARALEAFATAGIEVILLKGAALAETVYPSPVLRPMGDIDLLVRENDLLKADAELQKLGYFQSGAGRGSPGMENYHHLRQHVHQRKQVVVEIHCTLLGPWTGVQFDLDTLWRRAQVLRTPGFIAAMLAPEDMLLHLCLHTALEDRFHVGLRQLTDIAEMARYHQAHLDWTWVEQEAERYGVVEPVFWVLYLTRKLLDAPVPNHILDRFRPNPVDEAFADRLERYLLENDRVTVSEGVLELLKARTARQKLGFLYRALFPPVGSRTRAYLAAKPESRIPFYYLFIRPLYLLKRYGQILASMMVKNGSAISVIEREQSIRERANRWRVHGTE